MRKLLPRIARALVLLCAFSSAQAAPDDGLDRAVTIERNSIDYVVQRDGSYVATWDRVVRINTEAGIKEEAQQYLAYNSTLAELVLLEAYTQKPDGRRVLVGPGQIKEQQEPRSAGAPMFQDMRQRVLIFPDVAVGDRLVARYQRKRHTALWPEQFEDLTVPPYRPIEQLTVRYDLPADVPLYSTVRGYKPLPVDAAPGRKVYAWAYQPVPRGRIERGSVSPLDEGPLLAVSTFKDWAALGAAYQARAQDKAVPSSALQALAQRLTAGIDAPRDQALALANWVRSNIRYVAVYVGPGGVVPHAADEVLANRYGDCKDHVILLEALLSAKGIDSTTALVNAGNGYRLDTVPTLGILNHAITFVPSLDLYIDSTADSLAAGFLPLPVLDKPVVLTRLGRQARTPSRQQGDVTAALEVVIDADGRARFDEAVTAVGWQAEADQIALGRLSDTQREQAVQGLLRARQLRGQGGLTLDVRTGPYEPSVVRLKGTVDQLLALPGPAAMPVSSRWLFGGIAQQVQGLLAERSRSQPFVALSFDTVERATYRLPATLNLLALPQPVDIHSDWLDYSARYRVEAGVLNVERRFVLKHPEGVVWPASAFTVLAPLLDRVQRDLQSQAIVQGKGPG